MLIESGLSPLRQRWMGHHSPAFTLETYGHLIDGDLGPGLSPLRLQRWTGHHSPAFTLETYGHLIDGDLGPGLDLRKELRRAQP
jgi:hypothetical protein